ncbi:N-acetylmuramoyl-L-alanine amidase [Lactiplantibacillus argentoratensis]|uniref:N-acetylmuramoyl-L-alanine amidase n=1 Tax=Lactiplantibacillus argentoratensis TaxID=271881 RepID=A0ABS5UFV8_9LACO|nr:N-acetylmuramoyl-L-alanine amidase [Lactiplantibacillus argentoratensis]MBT1137463.1 N-acetylmuramoyl-L-alanine amidase [Lactiplantibacillus argentoratensis]MBT1140321.1 N-acetylmuramoyl-L-alanine amidase [Lactiplantibacillus argentoratensis]
MSKRMKQMGILSALLTFVCLALLIFVGYTDRPNVSATVYVNAKDAGLSEKVASNTKILQKILDSNTTGTTHIIIPKGTYYFDSGVIKMHSNLTLSFEKGAIFKSRNNATVFFAYPSSKKGYDGGTSNILWKNAILVGSDENGQGSFTQSMNHAQDVKFQNCTFYDAENPNGHIFDLDGSHNISISNCSFYGFNANVANDYKEAIQIDYSNPGAMSYQLDGDKYDDLPSFNIYVSNNQFLPINSHNRIKYYAPNPIGQHATYDNGKSGIIHNIYFTNNKVVDSKPRKTDTTGTINFNAVSNLYIENNQFSNILTTGVSNYIRIYNPLAIYHMKNIWINNNRFTNVNPTNQYILIRSTMPENPIKDIYISNNVVTTHLTHTIFINSLNNNVTQKNNKFVK